MMMSSTGQLRGTYTPGTTVNAMSDTMIRIHTADDLSDDPSSPDSSFDNHELLGVNDDVAAQLAASGIILLFTHFHY